MTFSLPNLGGGVLPVETSLTISGRVDSPVQEETVRIVFAVDDLTQLFRFGGWNSFSVNSPIALSFRALDYDLAGGSHDLLFAAVDSTGNVSPPKVWSVHILAPTHRVTVTPSVTLSPNPSPTARPNVPIEVNNDTGSFNIVGYLDSKEVLTTTGYIAQLRIGSNTSTIVFGVPARLGNVSLSIAWRPISRNAVVLIFDVANEGSDDATVDIADKAPVSKTPDGHGFSVRSPQNLLTFITAGYPFVTPVSTFWFGPLNTFLSNGGWSQVDGESFSNGESALAFSWQGVTVVRRSSVLKSVVVRFGGFQTSSVTLRLTFPPLASAIYYRWPITIHGVAEAFSLPTGAAITLLIVITIQCQFHPR